MFGKSLPSTTRSGQRRQPWQQAVREGRTVLEEVRERHCGVQMHARVALGQVQELAILRRTEMRDHGGQMGMSPQQALERVRTGEPRPRDRGAAHVHDDRNFGARQ